MALRPHPSIKAQDLLRSTAPAGMPGESRSLPGAFPRAAFNLALEPRIMFDAAGAATYADTAEDGDAETGEAVTPDEAAEPEIVFIDSGIADAQALIDAIGEAAEIVILDGDAPALTQIADHLDGRSDLGAVHILSHGANGALKFASGVVDSGNLADFADDLSRIGAAIAEGGDILLYGCFVAADGQGQAFIDTVAGETGADIAASIDPTGADEIGGDWVLEHATGPIAESGITTLLAGSDFGGILTGPAAMTMDFGSDEVLFGAPASDVFVGASESGLLNGFDVSSSFRFLDAFGANPPDTYEFGEDNGRLAIVDSISLPSLTMIVDPDDAAFVWLRTSSTSGIVDARMDSTESSAFGLSSLEAVFFDLASGYTTDWIEFVGFNGLDEVGTFRIDSPAKDTLHSLDFTSATSGSFDNITGFLIRSNSTLHFDGTDYSEISALFASVAIDNMVIEDAVTNAAPEIGGVAAGQAVNDDATVTPFSAVTIADDDGDDVSVTIALDDAAKGAFTAASLGDFTDNLDGSYTLSERSAAAATTAIQALVFEPTENRVAPGTTETTTFTITVNDGTTDTVNDTTTVVSTSINDAPVIGGFMAGQAVDDNDTITPFAAATISDPDVGQTFTITVTLDDADKGVLTNLGDFAETAPGSGVYEAIGLANAAAAESALRALLFNPAENRVAPGATETTTFTVAVSDGGATVDNDTTTIVSTAINDAPTATNMTQVVTYTEDPGGAVALDDIVVTEPDVGQDVTATLTLNAPEAGSLSTGTFGAATSSYDAGAGIWTVDRKSVV